MGATRSALVRIACMDSQALVRCSRRIGDPLAATTRHTVNFLQRGHHDIANVCNSMSTDKGCAWMVVERAYTVAPAWSRRAPVALPVNLQPSSDQQVVAMGNFA